jgi:hypothetical protein
MALRPLTAEEMRERCDLAGLARVVSVGRATPTSPNLARLAFVEIHKGGVRDAQGPARYAHVRLHGGAGTANGLPVLGGWSDWWDYPAGEMVVTHLDWNERDGVYETTWPGAVWEARASAA